MNLWYFTFEYPPEFGGGLAEYMRQITRLHARRPSDSIVVFAADRSINGLFEETRLHENILLIKINPLRGLNQKDLGYWVGVSHEFAKLLLFFLTEEGGLIERCGRPDALEFADGFGIGYLTVKHKLALHPLLKDIPIILVAHTPTYFIDRLNRQPIYRLPAYWHGIMEKETFRGADAVISPSRMLMEVLAPDLPEGSAPVTLLRNPYEHAPSAPRLGGPDKAKPDHFYMASRLTHWKGVDPLIDAFVLLWSQDVSIPLRLYGADTTDAETGTSAQAVLEKKFAPYVERGLLKFEGLVSRETISENARTAFAQIHPSLFDNFPYSVIEAMAEGTVCIINRACGVAEICEDGVSAVIVDVLDPHGFAAGIRRVIALSDDEREKMTAAARYVVRHQCSYDSYWSKKEDLIKTLKRAKPKASYPFFVDKGVEAADIQSIRPDNAFLAAESKRAALPQIRKGLTVVIPYFNLGQFVDETLKSVFDSRFEDIHVNLIDDGSTEPESIAKLRELESRYADKGDRFRIFRMKNGGVANARNYGVRNSVTEYVALLDADDLVHHGYYERAIAILEHYSNVSFVGCWIEDFNEEGRIRNWATWNAEPPMQLAFNQTNCQSLVYRREAYLLHGLHDPSLRMFLDDWEGMVSLLSHGHRGVMIPEPLFLYRIRGNSLFRSRTRLWDVNHENIILKHGDAYDKWGRQIAAFLNANGPSQFYHVAGKPSALRK